MGPTVVYVRLVGLLVSFCYTVLFLILLNFLLIPDSPGNFLILFGFTNTYQF